MNGCGVCVGVDGLVVSAFGVVADMDSVEPANMSRTVDVITNFFMGYLLEVPCSG